MYTFFVALIVLASLLMIFIVLIQESKGGGLASNFSSSNAIMGVRKTADFVEKATWALAATMVAFSIVCAHTAPQSSIHRDLEPLNLHRAHKAQLPIMQHKLLQQMLKRLPLLQQHLQNNK